MIVGQTIAAIDSTGSTTITTVYTPWIATWGNTAIFSHEVIAIDGAVLSFVAKVYTKNTEDADPGTAKGTPNSQTTAGTYSITDATGLLELVRIEFALSVRAIGGVSIGFVHFRALNPSWKTN
jgi:hypothetical protein